MRFTEGNTLEIVNINKAKEFPVIWDVVYIYHGGLKWSHEKTEFKQVQVITEKGEVSLKFKHEKDHLEIYLKEQNIAIGNSLKITISN